MSPSTITPAFEQNLLKNEISGNYRQMCQARAKAGEIALELTFEQRMNRGLEAYYDLTRFMFRQALELQDGA